MTGFLKKVPNHTYAYIHMYINYICAYITSIHIAEFCVRGPKGKSVLNFYFS